MRKKISESELIAVLARRVEASSSQNELARELEVSAQYICDVLKGRRVPGAKLTDALGYTRVVQYVRG